MKETWLLCTEETISYEEEVDGKAFFDKIICLWKEYPHTICRRITASIRVDLDSDLGKEALHTLGDDFLNKIGSHYELEINKFIADRLGKHMSENALEVSFYEEDFLVRFYPVTLDGLLHPHFVAPYSFGCRQKDDKTLILQLFKPIDGLEKDYTYLKNVGFQQLCQWLKNIDLSKMTRKTNALLEKESYIKTYRYIRETYGRPICQTWTECSDPKKAVFEDCGITAYILELISHDILPKPKKFIDIGCGNGLLVHLLEKSGIPGYGVDVRSRKIWTTEFKHCDLRESAVDPQLIVSNEPHFDSDVDFLIGNHSDELTPWIPVMAAKLKCNFFLIPCCPYNFFGKYINNGSHLGDRRVTSQYESFFEWTATVAQRLGFDVKIDRLAIPSTKRLCIIGRIPEGGLEPKVDDIIELYTQGRKFVARPQEITNKNCTNIPLPDRERLTKYLFEYLLNSDDKLVDGWRAGGVVPLSELAGILSEEDKKLMKDQDGGLQTFLKNAHQVFQVYGGNARIRDFRIPQLKKKNPKRKKLGSGGPTTIAACWMAANHPDGCPLEAGKCNFAH